MLQTPRRNVIILGAGAFAEEVAGLAAAIDGCDVTGFVEGIDRERCQTPLLGLPVHWIEDIAPLAQACEAVCAVGASARTILIRQAAALGMSFTSLVHPSAVVSATATLGVGTIVGAGVVIAAHTTIGRHVIVNRGCLIGHHVRIDDHVTLGPGVNIGGGSGIADGVTVGMGAIILDHLDVGRGSIIGAGAVVTKPVPSDVQVVGLPARVVRTLGRME